MNAANTAVHYNEISRMFWGLIPFWAKDDSARFKS
jgi:putative SOS response-associated peptidase YedK